MTKPKKLTIVIITFHQDFALLSNLLQSIYENWNPNEIDSIKVVLNDSATYHEQFEQVIKNNTDPLFQINKVFHYELDPRMDILGWHSQQMFKCLISELIDTDWFLIHDCKDIYIDKVSIDDCFNDQGKAIMWIDHTIPSHDDGNPNIDQGLGPFVVAHTNSCNIFGIDPKEYAYIFLPFTTPFFIKTSMMKAMVSELKTRTSGLGSNFFSLLFSLHIYRNSFVTEFLLYNAYCISQNNLIDYVDWNCNDRKFFNSVSQNLDNRHLDGSRKYFRNTQFNKD